MTVSSQDLKPHDLKQVLSVYQRQLETYRNAINGLNVYPVPDTDTGTNMAQTLDAVVHQLDGTETMAEVTAAMAGAALTGASGTSGVILAQILGAVAEEWRDLDGVGPVDLVMALKSASRAAYGAVEEPAEGTMLTVLRAAAAGAAEAGASQGADLATVALTLYGRAVEALKETTLLLLPLRQAGVVDAGGAGLLLLAAALVEVVTGEAPDLPERHLTAIPATSPAADPGGKEGPRYEVMYFLEAPDESLAVFRERWADLGDSIVVVGGDGLWNCHIHTDDIGAALEAGIEAGTPRGIRVTDLWERVGELEADVAAGGFSPLLEVLDAPIGVVAVAHGPGLVERFRRLGVQQVVAGGRSANPTVEEVLAAVEEAASDVVVILPNNKSVVPVAEQVDGLTTKTVAVVPTRSVTQGLAAMQGYFPAATDLEGLLDDMAVAAGAIDFGEVTRAARPAKVDGWTVTEGDWLGVADGRVVVADGDRFATLRGLVAAILPPQAEMVTVYTGEGASASDTKALEAWVGDTHPQIEVSTVEGGQPLPPYLVAVE